MSNSWQKTYTELGNFVAGNPGIKIGRSVTVIPGDVRPEFHRLFGTVRVAFLEEKFPALLNEAKTLSRSYITVEEEVIKLLRLADVETSARLNWFLRDPVNGLIRGLFDLLFDLLKGKIDTETFEQEASRNIESFFKDLYRSGYEKWVALSLTKLLASDKTFNVTPPEFKSNLELFQIGREEPVPEPKESQRLSFEHGTSPAFMVPDFIAHSAKINRYVAIRTELGHAFFTAKDATEKREWYSFNSIRAKYGPVTLSPDLTIYVDDNLEDIAFIADMGRICRPDLIIECMEQKGWPEKEGLEKVKLHHNILKPRLGTYIVSREPVPEEVYKELVPEEVPKEPAPKQEPEKGGEDIHILTVGYDQSQLAPIIEALLPSEKVALEPESQ